MESKKDFNNLIANQGDLSNAIKALKILVNERFTMLDSVTIQDLAAINGLASCIEIASNQQFDNLIDYYEQEVTA
ncbi:hypothetical protein [Vagococcus fluvialis]|uniref:Uncharacterized protein n=1 Tax=Vagococcus fluvialis TaxID=2738 RepID=A0A7X6D6Q1_9ENTE|nr:hypothetical protein [Vagococcus fluvialis]NKC66718.1 hypothetical protein [Vagococcus fluvialis]